MNLTSVFTDTEGRTMPTQSDEQGRETFATGIIPAKRAVVQKVAQVAMQALLNDLNQPGCYETVNWSLMHYLARWESGQLAFSPRWLAAKVRLHKTHGDIDDGVADLVLAYCDAKEQEL